MRYGLQTETGGERTELQIILHRTHTLSYIMFDGHAFVSVVLLHDDATPYVFF